MMTKTRVLSRHYNQDRDVSKIFLITHCYSRLCRVSHYWTREVNQHGFINKYKGNIVDSGSLIDIIARRMFYSEDGMSFGDRTHKQEIT